MSEQTGTTEQTRPNGLSAALGIDLVLVLVFAAIGYWTHADELTLDGVATTAWPFLAALFLAHAAVTARHRPAAALGEGVFVWLTTVAGGMLLRRVGGDGTAVAFVVVATLFNAATLLGWRALLPLVRGRRR